MRSKVYLARSGLLLSLLLVNSSMARGDLIAQWTFETSQPVATNTMTIGPVAPEMGAGAASGVHASAATDYSSPTGNGSAHSFSSNTWAVGDYYQFLVSTIGKQDIVLEWDQTSSATGPRDFVLTYSTNGTTFTQFGPQYAVLENVSPSWSSSSFSAKYHYTADLSSVSALDNEATVFFRLVDNSTTATNGGTVGTGGTNRVDNFTVATVPEPSSISLVTLAIAGGIALRRRRQRIAV